MTQRLNTSEVLRLGADDDLAESFAFGSGELSLLSRRAPGKDGENEDGALIFPISDTVMLLAVADGCGGMPNADEAARRALESLASVWEDASAEDLPGRVLAGFDAANRAVVEMRTGAATTLAVVLIAGSYARAFHVGDSLVLMTGQRGRIRFSSTSHSPTGFGVEAGLLTEHEALVHEERSVVLNVVGTSEMFVEIGQPVRLRPRDTVMLSSDGLSDNMLIDDIVERIRTGPCRGAVQVLADTVRQHMEQHDDGHADDLTILAYRPLAQKPA